MLDYVVYRRGCPLCSGSASARELVELGRCSNCASSSSLEELAIGVWKREVEELATFFEHATGCRPWSLQLHWIKRLTSGESFAMIAPTGVGKSTLLTVYALYRAIVYGWKVYVLTPTREIAKQFYERMELFLENLRRRGYDVDKLRILFYDSSSRKSKQLKELIERGEFDILITSAGFLSRNFDKVSTHRINLIIADDLDALMKKSRNIDRVLKLLGFDEEDIELATRIVKLRQRLLASKLSREAEKLEELRTQVMELEAELRRRIAGRSSQLVVASATGRAKGLKSLVLRELLGFEGGALLEYWRNVEDLYASVNELEDVIKLVATYMGSGIVFLSSDVDDEVLERIVAALRSCGKRFEVVKSGSRAVDKFRRGEVDVLIGRASYYGILVRGLDIPERVRFVIFVGIPRIAKDLRNALTNPRILYAVLRELKRMGFDVDHHLRNVVEVVQRCTPSMLLVLSTWLRDPSKVPEDARDRFEELRKLLEPAIDYAYRLVEKIGRLSLGNALIVKRGSRLLYVKPDPYTYIQASGRCSRLVGGVKTFGISVVIERDPELVKMLETRLRKLVAGIEFRRFDPAKLPDYAKRAEETRRGMGGEDIRSKIRTALLVVESPTKARTIASFFGRPAKRSIGSVPIYETIVALPNAIYVLCIAPSLGHVTDLVVDQGVYGVEVLDKGFRPIYDYVARCSNCGKQFVGVFEECPFCGSKAVRCSYEIVNALRKIAMEVDSVFVATDPDTEGEKIAFDIYALLKPFNNDIKRIEFREITKRAILEALSNPRDIDIRRVEAQIVRRVADRWIGFEVSLWLQRYLGKPWLGAGRVQSPVLMWVVDRFEEYRANRGYYIRIALRNYVIRIFVPTRSEAEDIARNAMERGVAVLRIEKSVREVPPPPPFTTDELLYEAGKRFGMTAGRVMALAQALFESGLITYHRTDSTRVSSLGIALAREALARKGLENAFVPRTWGGSSGSGRVEAAHECIRPTTTMDAEELREAVIRGDLGLATCIGDQHLKLYDLIYRRFLASQMKSAVIEFTKLVLDVGGKIVELEVPTRIVEPGFAALYPPKLFPELGALREGDIVKPQSVEIARGSKVRLYTVADLVKMMKERGIGRPSTYAKAVENNVRHGYVVLSKKRKAAIPTKLGIEVCRLLRTYFPDLVGEEVTRVLEEKMDLVERGEVPAVLVLNELYDMVSARIVHLEDLITATIDATSL